ncbi:hypothetical protein [Nocardioides antri]|uniref:Uncharacterized protein n=1 Tax=Nocardioides antri TaxID=2607659 RepID=A0A5B1LYA5_9ACTN|nr:hypothetical protein [Nocardioides antri]KAA1425561.1 hypothetical protein F0U47_17355 [Nocardioides antri]
MTPVEYVEQVGQRMAADGCDVTWGQVGPVRALVGHRKDFRLLRIHLTTVVAAFPPDAFSVGQFARDVSSYAIERAGKAAGWVTIEAFAVIACDTAPPDATVAASAQPAIEWLSRTQPVVVETATWQVHTFSGRMWWGSAFNGYKRRRLQRYIVPSA